MPATPEYPTIRQYRREKTLENLESAATRLRAEGFIATLRVSTRKIPYVVVARHGTDRCCSFTFAYPLYNYRLYSPVPSKDPTFRTSLLSIDGLLHTVKMVLDPLPTPTQDLPPAVPSATTT
jgi:hypothetical protein